MTDKQLDDLFKSRLENHSSQLADDMWMRIANENKKRKRGVVLTRYLFFLLLLFIVGAGVNFFINDNFKTKNEINKTIGSQQRLVHKENDRGQETGKRLMPEETDSTANEKMALTTSKESELYSTIKRNYKKRANTMHAPGSPNLIEDNGRSNDNIFKRSDETELLNNSAKNELNKSKPAILKDSIQAQEPTNVAGEDKVDGANDKIAIELYVSPQLPINEISSGNASYASQLKNGSHARLSYNIGARSSVAITKQLSAKIGVVFGQINEKIVFRDSALGSNSAYNNVFKSIDIPLLLSYKLPGQRIIKTSFTSGILLNIHSSYKGAIPSVFGQALNLNAANVYNTNTGVSIYASMMISKEMNNRFSFFAEPYFCYPVKNMADKFQSFKQRINTVGVSFGVKYNLPGRVK
jgi:cytoskeletal protein RodZ